MNSKCNEPTWHNVSGNLPNAPVETVAYDQSHDQLYAANGYGVFYLKNGKKNMGPIGHAAAELPRVRRQAQRRREHDLRGDVRPRRLSDTGTAGMTADHAVRELLSDTARGAAVAR